MKMSEAKQKWDFDKLRLNVPEEVHIDETKSFDEILAFIQSLANSDREDCTLEIVKSFIDTLKDYTYNFANPVSFKCVQNYDYNSWDDLPKLNLVWLTQRPETDKEVYDRVVRPLLEEEEERLHYERLKKKYEGVT